MMDAKHNHYLIFHPSYTFQFRWTNDLDHIMYLSLRLHPDVSSPVADFRDYSCLDYIINRCQVWCPFLKK
jgi:hypothetical protein